MAPSKFISASLGLFSLSCCPLGEAQESESFALGTLKMDFEHCAWRRKQGFWLWAKSHSQVGSEKRGVAPSVEWVLWSFRISTLVKTGTFLERLITRLLGKKMPKKIHNRVCVNGNLLQCTLYFFFLMLPIKSITLFNILEIKEETNRVAWAPWILLKAALMELFLWFHLFKMKNGTSQTSDLMSNKIYKATKEERWTEEKIYFD